MLLCGPSPELSHLAKLKVYPLNINSPSPPPLSPQPPRLYRNQPSFYRFESSSHLPGHCSLPSLMEIPVAAVLLAFLSSTSPSPTSVLHIPPWVIWASPVAQWSRVCLQCGARGFNPWGENIPGGGNGNPLQYSCPGNPVDRGAGWVTVQGWPRVGHDWVPMHTCVIFLKHRSDCFTSLSTALDSSPTASKTESRASECVWPLTNLDSLRTMHPHTYFILQLSSSWATFHSSKAGFFSQCFAVSSTCPPD